MTQLVYVMAPFGGDLAKLILAEHWCSFLSSRFDAFFMAPWVPLCRDWTNNGVALERGMRLDCEAIRRFDAAIAVGGKWSTGMIHERSFAESIGKLIEDATQFETPNQLLADEDAMARLESVFGAAK